MHKKLFAVLCLFISSSLFASPLATIQPTTTPTSSSKPLPTLQTVHNLDTVLSEKVQYKLTKIPALKGQAVSAASNDQIIILQGSVESKEQENLAIHAAKSVKGVKKVVSQLTIKKLGKH